jgi:hypothetical protein
MEKHNSSPTALPSRNTESGAHLKQELIDTSRPRTLFSTHMARQTSIPSWCNRLCLTPIQHLPAKLVREYPPPHPLVIDPSRNTAVSFRRLFGSDLQFMQKVNEVSFAQSLDWHRMPLAPSLLAVLLLTLPLANAQPSSVFARSPSAFAAATKALDSRVTQLNPAHHERAYQLLPAQVWAQFFTTPQPSLSPPRRTVAVRQLSSLG